MSFKEFVGKYKSAVYSFILLIVLIIGYQYRRYKVEEKQEYIKSIFQGFNGETMGTTYSVKYIGKEVADLKSEVDALLKKYNQSVSTYIPDSDISRFNQTGKLIFNNGELDYFRKVLQRSSELYQQTNGFFDPTVMPLVNAYGFGYKEKSDSVNVDSLMQFVGMDKVKFNKDSLWITGSGVQLDFSAIAKGYGVDLVSELLEANDISNYMVEIGGEVRCSGKSLEGRSWIIGIENPLQKDDGIRIEKKVELENAAMATSGNYRNFYEQDGTVYAHTINPKTGASELNDLLSATIITSDCMTADALATACMAMGFENAVEWSKDQKELEVYFISNQENNKKVYSTLD